MENNNEDIPGKSWMGQKGFDEAKYYNDEKFEIGINHSDERIKAQVKESLARNNKIFSDEIEVDVKEGVVTLKGKVRVNDEVREASDSIQSLSGVKMVRNLLSPY